MTRRYCFVQHDIQSKKRQFISHFLEFNDVITDILSPDELCINFDSNSKNLKGILKKMQSVKAAGLSDTEARFVPEWRTITDNVGPFVEMDDTVIKSKITLKENASVEVTLKPFLYLALAMYDKDNISLDYHKNFENSFNAFFNTGSEETILKFSDLNIDQKDQADLIQVDKKYSTVKIDGHEIKLLNYSDAPRTTVDDQGYILPGVSDLDVWLNWGPDVPAGRTNDMSVSFAEGSCLASKWQYPLAQNEADSYGWVFIDFEDPYDRRGDVHVLIDENKSPLSNMSNYIIVLGDDESYASVEHYYQSLKFMEQANMFLFTGDFNTEFENNPFNGQEARRAVLERKWAENRDPLIWTKLKDAVREKISKDPASNTTLTGTSDSHIYYISADPELGTTTDDLDGGTNRMGDILMKIRNEIMNPTDTSVHSGSSDDSVTSHQDYATSDDEEEVDANVDRSDDVLDADVQPTRIPPFRQAVPSSPPSARGPIDTVPDFLSLDEDERRYLPIGLVLPQIQQLDIIYRALKTKNFEDLIKVNNSLIKRTADELCALKYNEYESFVKNPKNSAIVAFFKYANERGV